ncbi:MULTISPECIES: ABC transporter permease [Sphingobacterium]|uniref:Cell division protein FtsX n=1 Tax=Sphingobacterium athyrii TaxID=2152717 RepID=A0A363NN74_9SPHI|nr:MULTISPECIES: ABC transporter permease [Sphingobacterium]PUV22203.1 cell division protein FtsX [Sphingobacterium athyrii]QIH32250.1 FtsX-like permease family protein [Sphingobacterium sp. DR205]
MIANSLKTAYRFLKKHKLITFINITSLAIGITATLVIFLMIQYDYSFDKHVSNQKQVYRVVSNGEFKNAGVYVPLVRTMQAELPNLEAVAPIYRSHVQKLKVSLATDKFQVFPKEQQIVFTNSQYFDIFPYKWLAGNAQTLNTAGHIVLTKKALEKFYGKESPSDVIGRTVIYADSIPLQVAGVIENPQHNSDFNFDSFIAESTIPQNNSLKDMYSWDAWNSISDTHQVLIKTKAQPNPHLLERNIANLLQKYKYKEGEKINDKLELQALADVHFDTRFNYDATHPGTLRNLILLAFFLLALGAVNFINLSTAQSIERAKEVGIRKTLGSSKATLIKQFLLETFLITLSATILAVLLLPLFLHVFEGFIPKNLNLDRLDKTVIAFFLFGQLILVTLLAGFYPAWVLTGYAPVLALKNQLGKNTNLSRSSWLRKALTIFQFVMAQAFLICVLIVVRQINYVTHKDMGFQKDAIVNIYIPGAFQNSAKGVILKNELKKLTDIKAISFGNIAPAMNGWMTTAIAYDQSPNKESLTFDGRSGDENYLDVYKIPLIAGRNVRLRDSTSEMLINRKGLELLHIKNPQDAIGKTFENGQNIIVGVMEDFDLASARQGVKPVLYTGSKTGYVLHIALDQSHPENWKNTIDKITLSYKSVFPDDELDLRFLNEVIQNFYTQEKQLSKLLSWAVGLSVFIAGLGLFGLAIFTANQRTKEIGIRKVLGASVFQITFLLLRNLLSLVAIACLVAFPIAYYFMHNWLNDFVYRTTINPWIFGFSALSLIAFASVVLSAKSIMAAKANPVNSLRDE